MPLNWTPEMSRKLGEAMEATKAELAALDFARKAIETALKSDRLDRAVMKARFPGLNWSKLEGHNW